MALRAIVSCRTDIMPRLATVDYHLAIKRQPNPAKELKFHVRQNFKSTKSESGLFKAGFSATALYQSH